MKSETYITYDEKPCRVLNPNLTDKLLLIENQLGRVDWLQKFITQEEFQRAMKGKPQPKFEKGKAFRIMYENKAVSGYMTYALCVNKKKELEQTGHYKYDLKIEQ